MTDQTDDELARAAEAEAAEAEERAEAARARAEELRRKLQPAEAVASGGARNTLRTLVPGVAAVLTVALLAVTGWMLWQHQQIARQHRSAAEYAAAARQGVINLMSIDYKTAKDSVARVLDGSSGRFKDNFEETADDFVKAMQDEKIVTKATVNDVAVESMSGDTALVLVSATSRREGPQAPKDQQQPRLWRVVLNMVREDGQIKMSGVEFV